MVCMIIALASSVCFLIGYVTYHARVGEKSSGYVGWLAGILGARLMFLAAGALAVAVAVVVLGSRTGSRVTRDDLTVEPVAALDGPEAATA